MPRITSAQAAALGLASQERRKGPRKPTPDWHAILSAQLIAMRLLAPEREWRFHPKRRWRFDCAWPERMLALEVNGGGFLEGGGRHHRGAGAREDCVKLAHAVILGWRVFQVMPEHVTKGTAALWVAEALRVAL